MTFVDDMLGGARRSAMEEALGAALFYLDQYLLLNPEDELAHDANDALELFIATVLPRAMPMPVTDDMKAKVDGARAATTSPSGSSS